MKTTYWVDYYRLNKKEHPWENPLWTCYDLVMEDEPKLKPWSNRVIWCSTTTAAQYKYNTARMSVMNNEIYDKLVFSVRRKGL